MDPQETVCVAKALTPYKTRFVLKITLAVQVQAHKTNVINAVLVDLSKTSPVKELLIVLHISKIVQDVQMDISWQTTFVEIHHQVVHKLETLMVSVLNVMMVTFYQALNVIKIHIKTKDAIFYFQIRSVSFASQDLIKLMGSVFYSQKLKTDPQHLQHPQILELLHQILDLDLLAQVRLQQPLYLHLLPPLLHFLHLQV